MADIITRLLLKTNDFDANLNKAKGSVNQFQGGIANMAKTAGAGIMKFAGAIGVAVGAAETFGKIMGSQQSTQDEWNNNIYAAKLSVEKFFTSINNGDWTSFHNGFAQSFIDAKNLSAEIDALNDKRLSLTYIKSEALAKIEENRAIATDTTESKETRRAAFAAMQNERKALAEKTNETIKKETDVLIKELNVKYGDLGWGEGDVIEFVVNTNFTGGSAEFQAYKEQLAKLKSEETKTMYHAGGVTGGMSSSVTDEAAVERTRQFKIQNQYLEKQRILEQEIDESRIKTVNLLRQQAAERRELSLLEKSENRIKKQLNGGAGSNQPTPPPVGSLAALDAEISKQNKKLAEATTMQARAAVQATIQELEQKKIVLELEVKKEVFKNKYGEMKDQSLSFPATSNTPIVGDYQAQQALINWYNQSIAAKKAELSNVTDADARLSIQMQINKLERLLKEYKEAVNKAESVSSGSIYSAFRNNSSKGENGEELDFRKQLDNMKLPKFKSPIKKDDVNLNKEYAESLEGVGTAFGSMGQMASQFGEDGLAFALNSVGTIAQMIIQLESLATAQGVASAMALPFPANLGAIATVIGAITSIFSSLPTFETGGIIPGTSFSGDKVLARVNSGEMILNSEQQSNLFKMLNSKLYGGLNIGRPNIEPQMGNIAALIAPGGDNQKIELAGNIRIKAQELELILKNRERITGRIR